MTRQMPLCKFGLVQVQVQALDRVVHIRNVSRYVFILL